MSDSQLSDCGSQGDSLTFEEIVSACNTAGISVQNVQQESDKLLSEGYLRKLSGRIDDSDETVTRIPVLNVNCQPESPGDLSHGRKRKKRADKSKWKSEISKVKRLRGESYMASTTLEIDKQTHIRKRKFCAREAPAKAIGSTCSSKQCLKSNKRKCGQFSQQEREEIFNTFWKNMDWGEKKEHVISLVDFSKPKRRRCKESAKQRQETYLYHLKKDGIRLQVCRHMFVQTLGIGSKQLRGWLKNRKVQREKSTTHNRSWCRARNAFAKEFLTVLPKLPSHYCRQSTSKLYLEPSFQSKRQLYGEYKRYCLNGKQEHVSWGTFHKLFESMNLGLYQPKKDWCDVCSSHQAGNVSEEDWTNHVILKDAAREEKSNDKKAAFSDQCHVLCVDVQAVQLCPVMNASALYYKTKLIVHNYTVYDMKTRNVKCFLFDETQGELRASVLATCLINYLDRFNDEKPIIIYSDGATCQNRNAILSNALLDLAIKKNVVITQKYLIKGHTQMEVDSVHSAIERKLKNRSIYLPTDYVEICREARQDPFPYEVEFLGFNYFKNYTVPELQRYNSIRPGTKAGDKCVTDIRQLQYKPNGMIEYKLDFSDKFMKLPREPTERTSPEFPPLYDRRLPINKRKFKDLQDLLHVIPASAHSFYNTIPSS